MEFFSYLFLRKFHEASRFTDSQIIAVIKHAETGTPVPELCREHGISSATFCKWRSEFGGMDASLMSQLKELQGENRRLRKMYAESQMTAEVLHEAKKNGEAISTPGDGQVGSGEQGAEHPARLPGVRGQPDLLPLSSQSGEENVRIADLLVRLTTA